MKMSMILNQMAIDNLYFNILQDVALRLMVSSTAPFCKIKVMNSFSLSFSSQPYFCPCNSLRRMFYSLLLAFILYSVSALRIFMEYVNEQNQLVFEMERQINSYYNILNAAFGIRQSSRIYFFQGMLAKCDMHHLNLLLSLG